MANDNLQSHSKEVFYIIGVFMSIILLLGVFLNLAVIIVFWSLEKKKKNTLNILIISVSISNLLQSVIAYPISASTAFHTQWIFGDLVCIVDAFWVHWMALVSINHLTVFSLER